MCGKQSQDVQWYVDEEILDNLIASVPERHTGNLRAAMHSFTLPVSTPEFTVSMLWHPRLDADLAHRWLRECVRDAYAMQFIT